MCLSLKCQDSGECPTPNWGKNRTLEILSSERVRHLYVAAGEVSVLSHCNELMKIHYFNKFCQFYNTIPLQCSRLREFVENILLSYLWFSGHCFCSWYSRNWLWIGFCSHCPFEASIACNRMYQASPFSSLSLEFFYRTLLLMGNVFELWASNTICK